MAKEPELRSHQEWLGYIQPVGLVVSPPALLAAQAYLNKNIISEHNRFITWTVEIPPASDQDPVTAVTDLPGMFQDVFGWEPADLVGGPEGEPLPDTLEVVLTEYNETLRPTYVVREVAPKPDAPNPWLMLIQVLPLATPLDSVSETDNTRWQASAHSRFERLLRETGVPIGLLVNGTDLRLVYAPRGENSGWIDFPIAAMSEIAGRPIFAALHMLLSADRLFSLPEKQRLPAILAESRKYQNLVSTKLAQQVLAALYELLRGFQAANDQSKSELLREVLAEDPNHVYHGLLSVLMRLVFILYAEDRGLLSGDDVYIKHYSVTGLFERLRDDDSHYPDTMDQRYGAWAQLLSLFRLVYDGASHGAMYLPPRHGHLFDPDRYSFLEGRPWREPRASGQRHELPMVADGVLIRVLTNLLILDGERLSYRTLDVEQIGSVYETMMGFNLELAAGRSIAIKPKKAHGAPATVNLDALIKVPPKDLAKWFLDQADQKLTAKEADALKESATPEAVVAALGRKVALEATPNIVPPGAMVLQPSDERRRSGSHYTPRSLTEPIVRTTLRPVLERLGARPTPEQILALEVCDPAMGSGAFLVEACRQLGDALVKTWHEHDSVPVIPPDEDEVLFARRLVAQNCLHGVDKNPMAVDLAKLSLWLATLAKDHPFTFLDHALRCGDSLVGLTRRQIESFHWDEDQKQLDHLLGPLEEKLRRAQELRLDIQRLADDVGEDQLRDLMVDVEMTLDNVRLIGDLAVAAFFAGNKAKEREKLRLEWSLKVRNWLDGRGGLEELRALAGGLRQGENPIQPFHWEIEFPEIFSRHNPGFDAIVGNPPFAGRTTLSNSNHDSYIDWLKTVHEKSHGNSDLVAHFFRHAFILLKRQGCLGLLATKTIGQGDTRTTGLQWICSTGGTIYNARKRFQWPGLATVAVSIVHVCRGDIPGPYKLDGQLVPTITSYLFHAGGDSEPARLSVNAGKSFQGCVVVGLGFTFNDGNTDDSSSPLSLLHELVASNPRNAERIFPYIGGAEVNDSPTHESTRYIINFDDLGEDECWDNYPDLMKIVEEKVKPERLAKAHGGGNDRRKRAEYWWRFSRTAKDLYTAIHNFDRVLVTSQVSKYRSFAFLSSGQIFDQRLVVFALREFASFAILQSQTHQIWETCFGLTLRTDPTYTPTTCFETFPFPKSLTIKGSLEHIGSEYYEFRSALMIKNSEGLTTTYNRFHDPEESSPKILKLRELHSVMDRAVLDAYGWTDIPTTCEFLLDYEDEADEEEETGRARRRKKPWRCRWPDEIRDEVLARLLALNRQRAEEEQLSGAAAESKKKGGGRRKKKPLEPLPADDMFGTLDAHEES